MSNTTLPNHIYTFPLTFLTFPINLSRSNSRFPHTFHIFHDPYLHRLTSASRLPNTQLFEHVPDFLSSRKQKFLESTRAEGPALGPGRSPHPSQAPQSEFFYPEPLESAYRTRVVLGLSLDLIFVYTHYYRPPRRLSTMLGSLSL